ncbi:MAG: hypothetical protein IJZ72_03290 [Oscillospiraceae bacterium]|nr:hypothetical protein [Oscillospiraceae bacterium]
MSHCLVTTISGPVLEIEQVPISEKVGNLSRVTLENKDNIRTPEEKEKYNRHKSCKVFVRIVCSSFTSKGFYVTLTYSDEYLPSDYQAAQKELENYIRRLKYSNPNAVIVAVTGYGKSTGRLHHHLIIEGVNEADIFKKWGKGEVVKAEHLREHNIYNGIDHGEDFTALAEYLHAHTPSEHKGRRWKQTKNISKPYQKRKKLNSKVYSPENPPKAPEGYKLVTARPNEDYSYFYKSGYSYFKYVRIVDEPLNIQPNFKKKAEHKRL